VADAVEIPGYSERPEGGAKGKKGRRPPKKKKGPMVRQARSNYSSQKKK